MAGSPGEGPGAGGSSQGRPGPDGHHDDLDPGELGRLDVSIPDDASELDRDRDQWLAESRAPRPIGPRRPLQHPEFDALDQRRARQRRRLAITAGVVLVSMVVVALSGAVGAWIVGPRAAQMPAPLATEAPDDGLVGGVMPANALLENGEAQLAAQSIRPAVFVVVPPACMDCAELLTSLAPQVAQFGVPLVAVGGPTQADQLDQLAKDVDGTRLVTLTDPGQTLAATYGGATTTVVVVGTDGVITNVIHDPMPTVPIESDLVAALPGT